MALPIVVAPEGDRWIVRAEELQTELTFSQGGRAETWARALAEQVAAEGRTAEVSIYLRDGALAGRFVHAAAAAQHQLAS
jgi:hypothetical protein